MTLDSSDAPPRATSVEGFKPGILGALQRSGRWRTSLVRGLVQGGIWLAKALLGSLRVGVFAFCVYAVFFNLSVVRGSSMSPGIRDGDRILIEPWSYVFGGVDRGDVIVLRYPLDPEVDYIKRVIGLPGDRIILADGRVWVNGHLLDEPYVDSIDVSSYLSVRVESEHLFVLGDNRPRSSDSREFGQVSEDLVRGRVDLRLWPPSRAGWIQ
jgi:signal peptidase I